MRVSMGGPMTALRGMPDVVVPQLGIKVDDEGVAYDLEMTVAMVHGAPVCTALTATQRPGGPPVTRQGLNSLPLNRIVREAVAMGAWRKVAEGPGFTACDFMVPGTAEDALRAMPGGRHRPADPGTQDQRMRDAVKAYKELTGSGHTRPKPVIARSMGFTVSYVSKLLTRARREGLLGPARSGRAGEASGE